MKSLVSNQRGAINLNMITLGLNVLGGIALLGVYIYTTVIFKKPVIVEHEERKRLQAMKVEPKIKKNVGLIHIPELTVNIQPTKRKVDPYEGSGQRKPDALHFVTLAFSLELQDIDMEADFERVKDQFLDLLIQLMSDKEFGSLTSVHGRFLLRTEVLDLANKLLGKPLVTNVFFTNFIVQ